MINNEKEKTFKKAKLCKRCGETYDANYKACPNCGHNPLKDAIKTTSEVMLVLTIIATLALSIIMLIKLNNINNQVADINNNIVSLSDTSQTANIENYTFYKDYSIYDGTVVENLGEEFYIYFHQTDCPYCQEANQYILSYYNIPVEEGSNEYIYDLKPIYFAKADSASELFNSYNIDSTPTLIHFVNGKEVSRAIGPEEVSDMLLEMVHNYYPENN